MSDRWLDLDRLISIKWLDKVIDPREVVYVLRGEDAFQERDVTCGFRDLTRPSMPACTKPPHPVTERHEWPSMWPATEDYEATPQTEQETTKVEERPDDDPAPVATCNGRDCGGRPHE